MSRTDDIVELLSLAHLSIVLIAPISTALVVSVSHRCLFLSLSEALAVCN